MFPNFALVTGIPFLSIPPGNSGPADLYHGDIFISAPEQYKMDSCADQNGTRAEVNSCVSGILAEFTDNAAYDARFGLEHWPLFFASAGLGDSGNRFPAYAAVASGAGASFAAKNELDWIQNDALG
mgnify:CR=1 FL=1